MTTSTPLFSSASSQQLEGILTLDICPFQCHGDSQCPRLDWQATLLPVTIFCCCSCHYEKKKKRNGVALSKAAAVLSLPSTVLANQVAVVDAEERGVHRIEVDD
jgi:hypothetical protein